MKKVLIWDIFARLNVGGPLGYLYNIKEYLLNHPSEQITFYTDLVLEKYGDAEWLHPDTHTPYRAKTFMGRIWMQLMRIYNICIMPFNGIEFHVPQDICIDEFDYVHIHQVTHFQQFKQLYPNYKGKVILTSHSPCPFSDELIERVAEVHSKRYKLARLLRSYLLHRECDAYDKTDYVMFPCAGARDSYEKHGIVRKTFMRNNKKFFYVPSSIIDYRPDLNAQQKLSDFHIPSDAFVITYFGRHIPIKGYDILTKIGVTLLEKYENLYFLCAGRGPIQPPRHPRWIELGFINNVDDLLPQSNLYVLPNRETYFDLITLQILRAGVPLALSSTGGNNFFKELPADETKGMMYFDINDENQMVRIVEDVVTLKDSSPLKYAEMRHSNRKLYESNFTLDKYINNYIDSINRLN